MMLTDLSTWLPDESLTRSNKMSMAVGLEQRVPLLDQQLVELGFSVPTRFKISGKGMGKAIFKEALKDYLPAHVLHQKKWGWFSPAAKWLRTDMYEFAREVLSPGYNAETAQYFDFTAAHRMLEDHVAKRGYHLNTLWALMTFQVWFRKMMK
jgi:asparagine synthase (glutamine-hydrolysing)